MNHNVGFIGLGEMGLPMATNLCKAGFKLTVFDLNNNAIEAMVKEGARSVSSCHELAKASETVILMVRDSSQIEQIMLGDQGVIAGAQPGAIIIIMSTVEPSCIQKMARLAEERGLYLLDAPVSGAYTGATGGTLTIMVGGSENIFKRCESLFNAMGKNIFYLGKEGAGEYAKLINNMILLVNMSTVYEAFSLADKVGLDEEVLLKIIKVSTGRSWVVDNWKLVSSWKKDYEPNGTLDLALKDLKLILSVGEEKKLPLLFASLACQLVRL